MVCWLDGRSWGKRWERDSLAAFGSSWGLEKDAEFFKSLPEEGKRGVRSNSLWQGRVFLRVDSVIT
jgi:hypothetical protein